MGLIIKGPPIPRVSQAFHSLSLELLDQARRQRVERSSSFDWRRSLVEAGGEETVEAPPIFSRNAWSFFLRKHPWSILGRVSQTQQPWLSSSINSIVKRGAEAMQDPRISQHRTRLLPANVSLKESSLHLQFCHRSTRIRWRSTIYTYLYIYIYVHIYIDEFLLGLRGLGVCNKFESYDVFQSRTEQIQETT